MTRKMKNILMCITIILLIIISGLTIYFFSSTSKTDLNNDFIDMKNEMSSNFDEKSQPEIPNDNKDSSFSTSLPEKDDNIKNDKPNDLSVVNNMNFKLDLSINSYIIFGIQSFCLSLILIYLFMSKFNKKSFKQTFINKDKIIIYILSTIILTELLIFTDCLITKKISNNIDSSKNIISDSSKNISYSSVKEIISDAEITDESYISSNGLENAVLISGDIDVTLKNINIEKTGDSDGGDNSSFYGINSALLAKDKATLTLENLNVTTDATGANGIFSYGGNLETENTNTDKTTININNSTITTKKDNSGGIMTTGGGITNAYNLTVNTSGISSAAIRTDRGGGVVNVSSGTYKTTGAGSPTIYSTAQITAKNAFLISEASEGIVVEGKNSVELDSCNLTDSNTKLNGLSTTYKNIFLYQSMSGDASLGSSSFTSNNSKIITNNGDTFYVTNTDAIISLNNNEFINNDINGNFLRVKADSWGNKGSNGGNVILNLNNQKITGNIVIDNISTLDMSIAENSYYEGAINENNSAKKITLKLDKFSGIKLTKDSYITSLDNDDNNNSNIDFNGYKLYVNGISIN